MSFFAILLALVLEQARPLKTDNQVLLLLKNGWLGWCAPLMRAPDRKLG